MADLYTYFTTAGINADAASIACVITWALGLMTVFGVIKWLFFPKK